MISQSAEYALQAMVCLAGHSGQAKTVHHIAEETGVPKGYLAKVMQEVARAGLVSSQRGLGGGFSLTRSPDQITVLDVVNAVDPIKRITRCPVGNPDHEPDLCPLHRKLDEAASVIEDSFRACTLAELIEPSR